MGATIRNESAGREPGGRGSGSAGRHRARGIIPGILPSGVPDPADNPIDSPPMTDLDEFGRPEPPLAGDEAATLLGFLDFQRATLAWKCAGLDADGLRATVGPSTMTLGGLLKHLAYVEDDWSGRWVWGGARDAP